MRINWLDEIKIQGEHKKKIECRLFTSTVGSSLSEHIFSRLNATKILCSELIIYHWTKSLEINNLL